MYSVRANNELTSIFPRKVNLRQYPPKAYQKNNTSDSKFSAQFQFELRAIRPYLKIYCVILYN